MNSDIHWASVGIVSFAALPAILFPVLYALRSRWRRNYVGIALMFQGVSIMVIMIYTLFVSLDPDFPYKDYTRITIFFLIGAMQWVLVFVLRKAQREAPRESAQNRRATDLDRKPHHGRYQDS